MPGDERERSIKMLFTKKIGRVSGALQARYAVEAQKRARLMGYLGALR